MSRESSKGNAPVTIVTSVPWERERDITVIYTYTVIHICMEVYMYVRVFIGVYAWKFHSRGRRIYTASRARICMLRNNWLEGRSSHNGEILRDVSFPLSGNRGYERFANCTGPQICLSGLWQHLVATERHLWLNLSNIKRKDKNVLMDAPIFPLASSSMQLNRLSRDFRNQLNKQLQSRTDKSDWFIASSEVCSETSPSLPNPRHESVHHASHRLHSAARPLWHTHKQHWFTTFIL